MNILDEKFSLVFDNLPIACSYSYEADGKLINVNNNWLKLFGYKSLDEVKGKSVVELGIFDSMQTREEIIEKSQGDGILSGKEVSFLNRLGQKVWTLTSSVRFEMDNVGIYLFLIRDITQQKQVELALEDLNRELIRKVTEKTEELRHSEWGLKKAQELGHLGHWDVDFINDKTFWSDEIYHMLGYEVGEIVPSLENYYATIHPDDMEVVKNYINTAMKTMVPAKYTHRSIKKDGALIYVYAEQRFNFDENRKAIGIYGINHDITQTKMNEERLLAQNKTLSDIAFMQSHQVRKPVAQVLGLLSLLDAENPGNPANIDILKNIKDTTKTFDALIHTISTLTNQIKTLDQIGK